MLSSHRSDRPHEGLPAGRTSRPRLSAVALACLGLLSALGIAACGGGGGIESGGGTANVETVKVQGKPSGDVTISNWPLYIDKNTVPNFEKATGVKVKYIEDVNDNAEFFGKMQPLLSQGQSGGRSLFVVTDWMAKKMYDLGFLQNLDKSALPNVKKNLIPLLSAPSFDPNRNYSVPWQGGMTGLVVRTDLAPDVHSICDLFKPQYKGKVTMLEELPDTVPLTMRCMGVKNPNNASEDQWMAAIDKIKAAADDGQIRRFTGNDYTRDLSSGDAAASIGWSGDAAQLSNPDISFVMPKEGCLFFSDNMVIPVGAPNPTAAEAFMNYVYDPKVQAPIAAYNHYITPVSGVKQIFARTDPSLTKNPLIFPSSSYTKNCVAEPFIPPGDEGRRIEEAWDAVISA